MYRLEWIFTQNGKRFLVIECGFKAYLKKRFKAIRKQSNIVLVQMTRYSFSFEKLKWAIKLNSYLYKL